MENESHRQMPSAFILAAGLMGAIVPPGCASSQQRSMPATSISTRPDACGFDTSGVRAFVAIADELLRNQEPTEQTWARLEATPGYAALLKDEFPQQHFRQAFRVALMPSRQAGLRAAIESRSIRYLDHYVRARDQLEDIRRAVSGMDTGGDCAAARLAVREAEEYLPAASQPREPPPVAMVIFAPDGRGYAPIVIDALFAREMKADALIRFLGHEFHHFYRNLLTPRLRAKCVDGADAEVLWALDQLQAEGTADQVNVRPELEGGGTLPEHLRAYLSWMSETPSRLERLQSLVLGAEGAGSAADELRRAIRDAIPRSGHPNGYYMARLIQERLGRKRLLLHLGDPFAFVRDYQEAAKIRSGPRTEFVFSEQFEGYLMRLEARVASCRALRTAWPEA